MFTMQPVIEKRKKENSHCSYRESLQFYDAVTDMRELVSSSWDSRAGYKT